ncbi:MAG: SpoIIE family protein phosphatase [Candidatus Zixiibacteriota bacterium]
MTKTPRHTNHSRREKLLLQATRMLNATVEYVDLIKLALRLVCGALEAEAALVYRVDEKITHRRVRLLRAGEDNLEVLRKRPGGGITGWVLENSEPALLNDPRSDKRYDGELAEQINFPLRNLIAIPLIARGRTFGVLEAINKREGGFDAIDQDTLIGLSDQIALSIDNSQLLRAARREARERQRLVEVSTRISGALDLSEALKLIMNSVKDLVGYDAGGIFLIDGEKGEFGQIYSQGYDPDHERSLHIKTSSGVIGWVVQRGESAIVPDVQLDDRYVMARRQTRSELVAPLVIDDRVIGVFNIESDEVESYDGHSAELLEAFGSQAAVVIERTRLHDEIVRSREVAKQMEIAAEIQREFLPDHDPAVPGYEISGINAASGEVGGDYYGFIDIVEGQTGLAIADVAGKGIPAALIMASFRASLMAEIRNNYSISEICRKVNALLFESVEPGVFVTSVYGALDSRKHRFTYSNAGHNPPFLLRATGEIVQLESGGPPFGIIPEVEFIEAVIALEPCDILLMYTDGVTEAEAGSGEQFGEERLKGLLRENSGLSAESIRERIYDAVIGFSGEGANMDDITMIVVKRI